MSDVTESLTIFFEEPFWVGVFERTEHGKLTAAKVVFGAEPKDFEVCDFVLKNHSALRFSPPMPADKVKIAAKPKRMRKKAKEYAKCRGVGAKSQQALKALR